MTDIKIEIKYTGEAKYQPKVEGDKDDRGRSYFPYFPSADLVEAVNLAILLNRPLLLEGEPGCGKTRLAGAIAYELTQKLAEARAKTQSKTQSKTKPMQWWFHDLWAVKSVGRAKDGLYGFDAVGRLRDAQLVGSDPERLKKLLGPVAYAALQERLANNLKYRTFGALGAALSQQDTDRGQKSSDSENVAEVSQWVSHPIVLIDEIDKADSDFPNDLLLELDQLCFEIPETGERYPVKGQNPKPIIIITSNRERPLSEAFLRRCLYFYVGFPDEAQLRAIIQARFKPKVRSKFDEVIETAIATFLEMRTILDGQPGTKKPGTSEILEFLEALFSRGEEAKGELADLAMRKPLLGILLKTQADQRFYRQKMGLKDD